MKPKYSNASKDLITFGEGTIAKEIEKNYVFVLLILIFLKKIVINLQRCVL